MSTTLLDLPLDQIHAHPKNVRQHASADDELIDSVRANGLIQPLVVAPATDGDGYILIAGHRRLLALDAAGRATAPALLREDLDSEARQIEAMLIENGRRKDLSAIEEADGYEQLELFGYKPRDIAKATGRSVSTVKERLRLRGLSTGVRHQLHEGQMSLSDAEALLEFSDDPEAVAELEQVAGTTDFRWKVQRLRDRRVAAERQQQEVKELADLGATVLDERPKAWDQENGPVPLNWLSHAHQVSDHDAECLAYVRPDSPGAMILRLCLAPSRHKREQPETTAPAQTDESDSAYAERMAQIEADREALRVRREAARAANAVRREWLTEYLTGALYRPAKAGAQIGAFAQAFVPLLITDTYLGEELVGLDDFAAAHDVSADGDWRRIRDFALEHADRIQGAPARDAIGDLALVLACILGRAVELDAHLVDDVDAAEARRQLFMWDWLRAAGYQLPTPDEERVAELVAIVEAENADDEEAAS